MNRPPARAAEPPAPESSRSDVRWVGPVLALIAFAVLLAFLVPRLIEDDPPESRTRSRTGGGGGQTAGGPIDVVDQVSFDPDGDGDEHTDEAPFATDGDPATSWGAEDYEDPLSDLGKSGIGLVLDLGSAQEVGAVEIATSTPGFTFEIRASDRLPQVADDAEEVESVESAGDSEEVTFDEVSARYWLVWITKLPGDGGGTVELQEVVLRAGS